MAGLVIDVGSWYRDQRSPQSDADAAALAGAHELPEHTASAGVTAQSFAQKNGYTLTASGIQFSGVTAPNDSITIKVKAPSPTCFTRLPPRQLHDHRRRIQTAASRTSAPASSR